MQLSSCVLSILAAGTCCGAHAATPWRGLHIPLQSAEGARTAERLVREVLQPLGVNVLVVEVNYSYQFESRPELGGGTLTKDDARRLAETCRSAGIRLIPLLNCLGHQSWAETTFSLLTKHPEFDETPDIPLSNPGIYCRSWCPLHPDLNPIVFDLIDELVDAFEADAVHVGMDEVFLIGSDQCARCRGKNPAELFAKAVNDLHDHIVGEKHWEMLMWGDRLLDADKMGYGEWESSANGTAPAVDKVPKDIIMCDWHYEPLPRYPSVRFFEDKGFRVLPCPWKNLDAATKFLDDALADPSDRMLGVLCTGWSVGDGGSAILADAEGEGECQEAEVLKGCVGRLR